jgi:peroxiredoxin
LTEYRDRWPDFQAAGAEVAAVSVDLPADSEALRRELSLPFPLLCDPNRQLITAWNLLNAREMGGIARPAVIVVDRERRVRLRALDRVQARVSPAAVLDFLRSGWDDVHTTPRRRWVLPRLRDWRAALRQARQGRVRRCRRPER